jgi:hypothetical protein
MHIRFNYWVWLPVQTSRANFLYPLPLYSKILAMPLFTVLKAYNEFGLLLISFLSVLDRASSSIVL